ncbi:MAG: OmpA family protein [Steroidobacteraceae bacterium]
MRVDFAANEAPAFERTRRRLSGGGTGHLLQFQRSQIKPQSQRALREIAALLAKHPQRHVSIEGHTDNIGGDRYNDDLSERRVAAVKVALVSDFHAVAAIIWTKGHGERQPIESNDTAAGRARNRRVELVRQCADAK